MAEGGSPWDLYRLIFETWRFQVDSYWTRAAYFAVFETGAVGAIVAARGYGNDHLAVLFALCGLALTVIWWLNNRRTHQYVDYWWKSLQELEEQLPAGVRELGLTSRYDIRASVFHHKRLGPDYRLLIQSLPAIFAAVFGVLAVIALQPKSQIHYTIHLSDGLFFLLGAASTFLFLSIRQLVGRSRSSNYLIDFSGWRAFERHKLSVLLILSIAVGIALWWWFRSATVFELLSYVLAMLAIFLAMEARNLLHKIEEAVPTQFIGSFPEYLRKVSEIIRGATHDILIMSDCADNGAFFNPELHDEVVAELKRKATTLPSGRVECLIWGGTPAALSRSNPLWKKDPKTLVDDPDFKEHIGPWMKAHDIDSAVFNPRDPEDIKKYLESLLLCAHDEVASRLEAAHVSLFDTTEEPHLFLWLVDHERALFMITTKNPGLGTAFHTSDPKLLPILYLTYEAYRTNRGTVTKYTPTQPPVSVRKTEILKEKGLL